MTVSVPVPDAGGLPRLAHPPSRSRFARAIARRTPCPSDFVGREIDDELRGLDGGRDAVGPEHRLLDGVRRREIRQDELGLAHRL